MRFCANVFMLFGEVPFLERFGRAAEAGFSAVEFWWPEAAGEDPGEVEKAVKDAGLEVAFFNFHAGDMLGAGDRGLIGDPEREGQFWENVPVALELARSLGCRRLNALAGLEMDGIEREEQLELARRNVGFAADEARDAGVEVVVEALSTLDNGPYLLNTTEQAVEFVRSVGRENAKIQHDFFQMQRMEGNLAANFRKYFDMVGHVQVADSPGRGEPGTGEIRYAYVFGVLNELGYDGYVGLEYRPTTEETEESLRWLPKELRGKDVKVSDLRL
jgi:hydroxypyruvate isomerase